MCAAAFALYFLCNWLLTNKFFLLATPTAPLSRDVGTLVQGLGLLALMLVSSRRPRVLRGWMFLWLPIGLLAAGTALLLAGRGRSAAAVTVGLSLVELVSSLTVVALGCLLLRQGSKAAGVGVLAGLAVSLPLRFAFDWLEGTAPVAAVFCAAQLVLVLLVASPAAATLAELRPGAAPEELRLTNPFSFLPLNHQLYVCLALFQLSYGYAIGFGEVGDAPVTTFAGIVPLAVVCVAVAVLGRFPRIDPLFSVAFLFIVAGYLFVPFSHDKALPVASNLLEAGSSCFSLVYWLSVAALARRNRAGALTFFAWGGCILSAGVVVGAFLGRLSSHLLFSDPVATSVACNVVALALVAYATLALKGFSFDAAIDGVQNAVPVETLSAGGDGGLARAVRELADEAGLTQREAEVFALLAQGRNGVYVQQELGVSYNTVKTHVSHIYAKLGVHTHQELIDLAVGRASGEGAAGRKDG